MAFIISLMLAELGNIYAYSSLPAQTEQAKISDSIDLLKNVQNGLTFLDAINMSDDAMLNDFMLFVGNFTQQKGYNTIVQSNGDS